MSMHFPHNLWDLSGTTLPPQITNLDESDFLSILSKQLNPTAAPTSQPVSLAQQITQQQGVSPPVSEESSPSPPTTTNHSLAKQSSTTDASAGAAEGNEMQHKRKKIQRDESEDSDSDDEQPPSKSQKEQPAKKGKRKSTGDEARAMKRKEQNRAAQRAFRERKEKHVKDLEDQVAALEQKSNAQATENENLRELLGRLQNENLMLKQSAFTFNFNNSTQTPRSTSTPSVSNNNTSNSRATPSSTTSPSLDKSPSSAGLPPATPKEPQSNNNAGTGYTPLLSFSSLGGADNLISMGTPPTNTNSMNTTANNNSPPLTWFSPPPTNAVPSPYTTLASNPMYTSYTDFSAWDQFFQSAALDQTLAGVGSDPSLMNQVDGSGRMEDLLSTTDNFSELIPFSSFSSPPPASSSNANNAGNSPIDHAASSNSNNNSVNAVAAASSSSSGSNAFSLASRETNTSNRPSLLPARSSSPCGGADPDEAPLPGSSQHDPSMTGMNVGRANGSNPAEHDGTKCPKSKADLEKIIESQPLATLGAVPGVPQTFSEKKTQRLKEVWNALKQHPRFEECDMDELCRELSSKVKCDGGMPGLDESDKPCEELGKIIEAVKAKKAQEAKAAQQIQQQQRVIQSISTGGLPDTSMNRSSPPTASSPGSGSSSAASPNMLSNFNLFGSSPYNFIPFAMTPQSATSQFGGAPQSASSTNLDFGFGGGDSGRPSLAQHGASSGSDAASFMSSSSSNVATPQSLGGNANGSAPMMVDQPPSMSLSQALAGTTGSSADSWLAGAFEMPSPNSQFLSFLNASGGGTGGFSPNSYLNMSDKE